MSTQKIYSLIPKIMGDLGAIGKDRKNENQGYRFRGIEDMYNCIQPTLVKHGVFCVPSVIETHTETFSSANGKSSFRVILKVAHKFYAEDGSYVEVITAGEGIDTSDKASNKAMSAAMKYAFIELFSIPTVDVEDSDRTTPEVEGQKQQPKIPAPHKPTSAPKGFGKPKAAAQNTDEPNGYPASWDQQ